MKINLKEMVLCNELKILLKMFKKYNVYNDYYFTIIDENYIHLQNSKKELFLKYVKTKNNTYRYKFTVHNIYVDYDATICKSRMFSFATLNSTYRHLYMMYQEFIMFQEFKGSKKEWFAIKRRNNFVRNVFIKSFDLFLSFDVNVENEKCKFFKNNKEKNIKVFTNTYEMDNKLYYNEFNLICDILNYFK